MAGNSAAMIAVLGTLSGAVLFMTWIGYGHLLAKALKWKGNNEAWLLAPLGAASLMVFGGVPALLGIVSAPLNHAVMLGGLAAFFLWFKEMRKNQAEKGKESLNGEQPDKVVVALKIAVLALLTFRVASSLFPGWLDMNDDWVTYFHFPKRLLETGSFIEPFNMRRLAYLGGAPYLESFLYPFIGTNSIAAIDAGLGSILIVMAAMGGVRGEREKWLTGLFAALLTFTFIFYNHTLICIPTAIMLAAGKALCDPETGTDLRSAAVLAVFSAGIIAIRNNYLLFVVTLVPIALFPKREGGGLLPGIRLLAATAACAFLLLIPWMAVAYKSSLTPFFPLIKGNYTYPFDYKANMGAGGALMYILANIYASKYFLILVLAAAALVLEKGARYTALMAAGGFFIVAVMVWSLSAVDIYTINRYCQPFTFAIMIFSVGRVLGMAADKGYEARKNVLRGAVAVFAAAWLFWPAAMNFEGPVTTSTTHTNFGTLAENMSIAAKNLNGALTGKYLSGSEGTAENYGKIQNFLPPGAKVLSVVDQPYLWDFTRQDIAMLDVLGHASPKPGMPFFTGPGALARYFGDLGYRYLVYTDFNTFTGLYSRMRWEYMGKGNSVQFTKWAPFFLDFFANVRELQGMGLVVFRSGNISVMDLSPVGR